MRGRLPNGHRFLEGSSQIGDFLAATGIRVDDLALKVEQLNRLNRDILDFQRIANRLPLQIVKNSAPSSNLPNSTPQQKAAGSSMNAFLVNGERRRAICESYSADNVEVARCHLGREPLFTEPSPDLAETATVASGLPTDKIACILGSLAAGGRSAAKE